MIINWTGKWAFNSILNFLLAHKTINWMENWNTSMSIVKLNLGYNRNFNRVICYLYRDSFISCKGVKWVLTIYHKLKKNKIKTLANNALAQKNQLKINSSHGNCFPSGGKKYTKIKHKRRKVIKEKHVILKLMISKNEPIFLSVFCCC